MRLSWKELAMSSTLFGGLFTSIIPILLQLALSLLFGGTAL